MAVPTARAIGASDAWRETPDPRMLRMLADRMPQAVGLFCPRRAPTYLNPAFERLLGLSGSRHFRNKAPQFRYALVRESGAVEPVSTVLHTLREKGEWCGDVDIRYTRRTGWSLVMTGRIDLLCEGTRRIGYAFVGMRKQTRHSAPHEPLTDREREVLGALVAGKRSKAIGIQLGISHRTVETHRANIMTKFRVRTLPDLFRLVMKGPVH